MNHSFRSLVFEFIFLWVLLGDVITYCIHSFHYIFMTFILSLNRFSAAEKASKWVKSTMMSLVHLFCHFHHLHYFRRNTSVWAIIIVIISSWTWNHLLPHYHLTIRSHGSWDSHSTTTRRHSSSWHHIFHYLLHHSWRRHWPSTSFNNHFHSVLIIFILIIVFFFFFRIIATLFYFFA